MSKGKWLSIVVVLLFVVALLAFAKGKMETKNTWFDATSGAVRPVAFEKGLPSLKDLVKTVSPAVVNISTTTVTKGPDMSDRFGSPFGPFRDFFGGNDMFEKFFGDMPRRDYKQRSLGSGFIIDHEGYILTNNHVVEKATTIKVKLTNGTEYDATVVGKDAKTDVALIKINAKQNLPVAIIGDSDRLEVGDWVLAIGNPFGLEHTVTAGIVSAKGRVIGAGPYDDFIQTDASINPGNSGGPLFNLNGEVVGINTAIISGGQGIGFATPVNIARDLLPQLKSKGKVTRGWLGVVIQKVTPEIVQSFGLKDSEGALVSDVTEGSPADKAGIQRGDVIVSFNGKKIKEMDALPRLVGATEVGKTAKLGIIRDGKLIEKDVVVAELRDDVMQASKKPVVEKDYGLVVQDITPDIARHLNLKDRRGVIVTDVQPGSPAQEADIRSGDIILEVSRRPIKNVKEFQEVMKKGNLKQGVVMLMRRENITFYVTLKE